MQKHFLAGVIVAAAAVLVTLAPRPVNSSQARCLPIKQPSLSALATSPTARIFSGAEAPQNCSYQIPGTVMAVGDLAYPDGSKENFTCYDKTWGRVKSRTRPAPGNHEFHAAGATPYFDYLASLPVTQRPATTATNSALGTSSY